MTIYFADSNALAKRYITEKGSSWVRNLANPQIGNIIILSDIGTVEIQRVFVRHRHDKSINIPASSSLRRDFLLHAQNQYVVISVDDSLRELAVRLIRKHQAIGKRVIRTLDAVQLACALRAGDAFGSPITFVTSDQKLLFAAKDEGFPTENPESYL